MMFAPQVLYNFRHKHFCRTLHTQIATFFERQVSILRHMNYKLHQQHRIVLSIFFVLFSGVKIISYPCTRCVLRARAYLKLKISE